MLHLDKLQITHRVWTEVEHPPLPQEKPMMPFHRDALVILVLMQTVEDLAYNHRNAEMWWNKREFLGLLIQAVNLAALTGDSMQRVVARLLPCKRRVNRALGRPVIVTDCQFHLVPPAIVHIPSSFSSGIPTPLPACQPLQSCRSLSRRSRQ